MFDGIAEHEGSKTELPVTSCLLFTKLLIFSTVSF